MLSYGLHTVSNQGARVVDGPPSSSSRAGSEIADVAYRQQTAERERLAGGFADHGQGEPGIGYSAAVASSGALGGGYALDPEQLARHIERFEQIARRITKQNNKWEAAWLAVRPPSKDDPATQQAERARESIKIGWKANEAKLQRMYNFIDQMKEAHGSYVSREDNTAGAFESGDRHADASERPRSSGGGSSHRVTGSFFEKGGQ